MKSNYLGMLLWNHPETAISEHGEMRIQFISECYRDQTCTAMATYVFQQFQTLHKSLRQPQKKSCNNQAKLPTNVTHHRQMCT